ncbi:MAG: DUF4932 domain-containing protein [Saprospiraceae bacterium]|nr:DUF4932 domain-containing protein [Saprospiraceae bacterium]
MKNIHTLLILLLFTQTSVYSQANKEIQFTETYELANVILALTPYGMTDPWEVQQGTPYYQEVMTFFKNMRTHPLIEKVNYSRERWEEYLSFRTDAYAFEVTKQGQIRRAFPFHTQKGQKLFDDHLALIQDFYEKSDFRAFYQQHLPYYEGIADRYKAYFMVDEMRQFLQEEFGKYRDNKRSIVVCSPLVNRMNCHRNINKNTSAEFATLGMSLINPEIPSDKASQASDIHLLFTEMDHGYVNPVSQKYAKRISRDFQTQYWDNQSGYTGINCFNEYMTWAVYDLFAWKYFPEHADQVVRDWHFQNNNRGFVASSLFGKKLRELYQNRQPGQTLKDLYPAVLNWSAAVQQGLRMPVLASDSTVISLKNAAEPITVAFTEPLQKMPVLESGLFKVVNGERELIRTITLEEGKNLFFEGQKLKILIPGGLPTEPGLYGINFNLWGRKHELTSTSGVSVKCPSRFFFRLTTS